MPAGRLCCPYTNQTRRQIKCRHSPTQLTDRHQTPICFIQQDASKTKTATQDYIIPSMQVHALTIALLEILRGVSSERWDGGLTSIPGTMAETTATSPAVIIQFARIHIFIIFQVIFFIIILLIAGKRRQTFL